MYIFSQGTGWKLGGVNCTRFCLTNLKKSRKFKEVCSDCTTSFFITNLKKTENSRKFAVFKQRHPYTENET